MTHGRFIGWAAGVCCAALACNGEKKPETPATPEPTPVSTVPVPSPSEPTPAPTPSTTAVVPAVECTSKESRAGVKRDTGRGRENKIVGGKPAPPNAWPFMVALAFERNGALSQYCGASLIGRQWVLTAAHCQVLPGEKAIVGRRDLTKDDGEEVPIARVLNHAAYDPDTNDNDIAVVQLTKEVDREFVELHEVGSELAGLESMVVGWGRLQEGGPVSPVLQEVKLPVVSMQVCRDGYASDSVGITDNMLCAGLGQGGKDSCQGDSGGPLLVRRSADKWAQAGVVSFGIGCARPNKYGVYTRVAKYVPWIRACTKS